MVNAELGLKRTCPSCAAKFYDLMKNPAECPKCGVAFIPEVLLPSKTELPVQEDTKAKAAEQSKPVKDESDEKLEVVSINDLDDDDVDEDDETAGIEDVEIDDDDDGLGGDDDTFLEDDDEDDDAVPGIVVKPGSDDDEA